MDTLPISESLFSQRHSLGIRIWHWVTFALFTATIATVLLANTLFDTGNNISTVQESVKQRGGVVTTEQAKTVAHEFNDKLWNTHKIIGYFLCFSFLSRIIIEVATSKEDKLINRLKLASRLSKSNQSDSKHYLIVKYGYLIFYILFFIMACTGLILAYEDVESLKPIQQTARSIHEFVQYCIYGYIVIHLVGVIRADVTDQPGIVSRMINRGSSKQIF